MDFLQHQQQNSFTSSRSRLSSDSFIQDNFRFQSYSYVVKAEKQLKEYADLLKRIFHPAGSVMFSEFTNTSSFIGVKFEDKIFQDTNFINPVIGNFMPYTFGATKDFRGDTYGVLNGDFYPDGFNGITAATIGNFDGLGNPVQHDPYNSGTFVGGPIGGFTFGEFDPDFFIDGSTKRVTPVRKVHKSHMSARMIEIQNSISYQDTPKPFSHKISQHQQNHHSA